MKIVIQSEEKKYHIILPTALLLNRFTATIATKMITNQCPSIEISTLDFMKLMNVVNEYKHKYKHLELVNIRCTNGDVILISL